MQAVTVVPGTAGSAKVDDVAEAGDELGSVVVEALAAGACGTDVEIASGSYGWAPPGEELPLAISTSVPQAPAAVGEWDMCSNGGCTERGIKQAHGFMAERWRIEPDYAVRVDKRLGVLGVLLEPT